MEAKFGAPTRISEANFGAKPRTSKYGSTPVPPGDILKVAVSTLSAKAKLFNNSIFNPNGNVAQDKDDGDDDMNDDDDKMPSQGQIVDLPAIHSQMTDAEIKKIFLKKKTC